VLLAAVYKSSCHAWNNAEIVELLCFRHKSLLAGDLNSKHPFLKSVFTYSSDAKLLNLLHINEYEISAPKYPTDYFPAENGDMLDIVVHKNVQLSEVIFCDIMDSDNLPIVCHVLDYIRIRIFRTRLTNSQIGSGFKAWP
jgi:hypothetical protein